MSAGRPEPRGKRIYDLEGLVLREFDKARKSIDVLTQALEQTLGYETIARLIRSNFGNISALVGWFIKKKRWRDEANHDFDNEASP